MFLSVRICDQTELSLRVSGLVLVDSEGDDSEGDDLVLVPRAQLEVVRSWQARVTRGEHGVGSAQLDRQIVIIIMTGSREGSFNSLRKNSD